MHKTLLLILVSIVLFTNEGINNKSYSCVAGNKLNALLETYYNPVNKISFRVTSFENFLLNKSLIISDDEENNGNVKLNGLKLQEENISIKKKSPILQRIGFRSTGCTCQQFTCGCCLGINLNQFQINREGCMNFTYDSHEFAVTMDMYMDGNSVFSNTISARNPPPLCIPVPIPYIPLQVENCAKLYDIHMLGQNLHMCFDFETRIERAQILILHFDCMKMGNDGVALVKPTDPNNPTSTSSFPTPSNNPLGIDDVFDPVTEIKLKLV